MEAGIVGDRQASDGSSSANDVAADQADGCDVGFLFGALSHRLEFNVINLYIRLMSKRSPRPTLYEWRITRIRSTPAVLIGHVEAPDADQAIQEAIRKYEITNPHDQGRLAAQRVKEVGV